MEAKPPVPTGLKHLGMVRLGAVYVAEETAAHVKEFKLNNEVIGTCLSALYQASTCHRKCYGGSHILESLCGRAYNLTCAIYNLTNFGLYDEALKLIRSLAEMTNLIMLLSLDQCQIQKWITSDRKKRLQAFSPAAIRRQLRLEDIYARMTIGIGSCLRGTRIRRQRRNQTIMAGRRGGKYEYDGMKSCYGHLMYVLTMLSLFICRWFEFNDLFDAITGKLRDTSNDEATVEQT